MSQAVRILADVNKKTSITVHDDSGHCIGTDKGKADKLKEWFSEKFTDKEDKPLPPFDGPPRSLHNPITAEEVQFAAKKQKWPC